MGPHYLHTFAYQYLTPLNSHSMRVDLKDQSIIIDANSFMYFIYDQILKDDKSKNRNQCLTNTPFDYDGYWNRLRQIFGRFNDKCSSVSVVFDGVYKRNADRRPDPKRRSISRFTELNDDQNQLPSLFRHEFINTLRELNIGVIVAREEADPMVARLAQDQNAYVVAADSDYHLYNLPRGYVPLKFLNLRTFKGQLYQMTDIFEGMDEAGVALWVSLVSYNFVSLTNLQKFLSTTHPFDRDEFESWLESEEPDEPKRQLITTEWSLLRFIQQVGSAAAYQHLIRLVPQDDQQKFNQLRSSYINITLVNSIETQNRKWLPSYLDRLFVSGNLDHAIIDILISRKILMRKQGNNPVYFQLLIPIIQILLRWDCQNTKMDSHHQTVKYKDRSYELLTDVQGKDLPSLDDIPTMSLDDRKNWLLYCVKSALQPSIDINEDGIHDDHLAWLCLLKLWWHKGQGQTSSRKSVLHAMIVSYLMYTLLDLQDQSGKNQCQRMIECGRSNTTSTSISEPFLQRSKKKLKKRFSSDACFSFNQTIHSYSIVKFDNENIKSDLLEAEQFYNVFYMINQFFDLPIVMPKPREYISELTYHLAIAFTRSKQPEEDIQKSLFQNNKILTSLLEKSQEWIEQVHQSSESLPK